MHQWNSVVLGGGLALLLGALLPGQQSAIAPLLPAPAPFDGTLSVLTYNVKGLPWPVALGRASAIAKIAGRLRALRRASRAPQIVVLQEAFTAEAQELGTAAGYRYVAAGPDAGEAADGTPSRADRMFAAGARWWRGETEGRLVGSGLRILSDYPVVAVHRTAFPATACAGLDCLANKGVVMATIAVPGSPAAVDVFDTHLNSRRASRADDQRSTVAYRRQVAALTRFVRANHDPRHALIVAGDFNMGWPTARRTTPLPEARTWSHFPVDVALDAVVRNGRALDGDAAYSHRRAKDLQFFAGGERSKLEVVGVDVPFGRDGDGQKLSDHVGYVARFRLTYRASGPTPSLPEDTVIP
ncbi:endonuclease/exonuclease/phosphatase family protein [Sphingomonas sp. MA1305]|uniref:endonuclease/exonuclease/phosphatase family protein n=1 Tax=Sphingomonas sp. MA1305 TaxID=2479204 RepID=UPI0018E061AA